MKGAPGAPLKSDGVSVVSSPTQDSSCTSLLREFPTLTLDKLGVYPGFQHHIQLQPGMIPVTCHMRPVPLALCEKGEDAVHELD